MKYNEVMRFCGWLALAGLFSGFGFAQETRNSAVIQQDGNNNIAMIEQIGEGNTATILTRGRRHRVLLEQSSDDGKKNENRLEADISGEDNLVIAEQSNEGTGDALNDGSIAQSGRGNTVELFQRGGTFSESVFGNTAIIRQTGDSNISSVDQTGADNFVSLDQNGNSNLGDIVQNGQGLSVELVQNGNGLTQSITQTGCVIGTGCGTVVVTQSGS